MVRIRPGTNQTLAHAKANLAMAISETGGRRRPLLIDIRGAQPLEAEARHHYSGQTLMDNFSAMALLIDGSALGRMLANVYLRIARPGVPTQLFEEQTEALRWLDRYRL